MSRIWTLVFLMLAVSPGLISPAHSRAQTDVAPLSVAAAGLINPRGFAFTSEGQLIVAESGTGGETAATEDVPAPTGPYTGGPTGAVVRIAASCPTPLAANLASARGAGGESIGPSAVVIIGDKIYALVAGGGAAHGNPDQPAGIYDVTTGSPVLLADLSGWLRTNPVANPPENDFDPDGSWYSMATDSAGSALWVVESNSEQVVRVDLDGAITRIADLSADNQVPTAIAIGPDGAIYVGHLTSAPFTAGSATVIKIGTDNKTETVWSGLTMITGLAIDRQGTLYASELSGGRDHPPFFVPGTGRIVRQTGADSLEEVATLLNLPTTIQFGPDAALYVSMPAVGADTGTGVILRVETGAPLPLRAEDYDLTPPSCSGAEQGPTLIKLSDLGIDPASITITAGTTVTWRNTGEFEHSTKADPSSPVQWDSGSLIPGQEFVQTFDQPGTYPYFDGVFPDHRGTIEVIAGQ